MRTFSQNNSLKNKKRVLITPLSESLETGFKINILKFTKRGSTVIVLINLETSLRN